jgi:hypothetical protein
MQEVQSVPIGEIDNVGYALPDIVRGFRLPFTKSAIQFSSKASIAYSQSGA